MAPQSDFSKSGLAQQMVEIFKQRGVYLAVKTWILFWPLVVFAILASLQPLSKLWTPWAVIQPILMVASIAVFLIFSLPKFRLFQIEELLWIKRYLRNKEIVPVEESHEFMKQNLSRITSYKRYVWGRYFLVPLVICMIPVFGLAVAIGLDGIVTGPAHSLVGWTALVSMLSLPLCGLFAIIYWFATRDHLRYVSISLVETLDSTQQFSNQQILKNATSIAHATKLKDSLKYIMEDLGSGVISGAPTAAIGVVSNIAPKPIAAVVNTYAEAYSVNAYFLLNAIETYAMYISVQSRVGQQQ